MTSNFFYQIRVWHYPNHELFPLYENIKYCTHIAIVRMFLNVFYLYESYKFYLGDLIIDAMTVQETFCLVFAVNHITIPLSPWRNTLVAALVKIDVYIYRTSLTSFTEKQDIPRVTKSLTTQYINNKSAITIHIIFNSKK